MRITNPAQPANQSVGVSRLCVDNLRQVLVDATPSPPVLAAPGGETLHPPSVTFRSCRPAPIKCVTSRTFDRPRHCAQVEFDPKSLGHCALRAPWDPKAGYGRQLRMELRHEYQHRRRQHRGDRLPVPTDGGTSSTPPARPPGLRISAVLWLTSSAPSLTSSPLASAATDDSLAHRRAQPAAKLCSLLVSTENRTLTSCALLRFVVAGDDVPLLVSRCACRISAARPTVKQCLYDGDPPAAHLKRTGTSKRRRASTVARTEPKVGSSKDT
jgi:hypothetical protein